MQSQLEKLDGIELKIRQLIEKLRLLKDENTALLEKNSLLNKEIEDLKNNIEGLDQKASPSRAESKKVSGDLFENQEIREEIDHYVEEIDKCIEILKLS